MYTTFRTQKTAQLLNLKNVLLVDNNGTVTVGAPTVEGAKVVCEVVSPLVKGDKVLVFHKREEKVMKTERSPPADLQS